MKGKDVSSTPYAEALEWIEKHPGTGSAVSLSKLVLSFWNSDYYPFPFAACVSNLDGNLRALAISMASHYCKFGETAELQRIGRDIYELSPRLVELAGASFNAMSDVRGRWDREDEEERRRLYPDD